MKSKIMKMVNNCPYQKGSKIVITNGIMYRPTQRDIDGTLKISEHIIEDKSYKGDVLEVIAVEMPYIVVKNLTKPFAKGNKSYDVREYRFKKVSEEYVQAMKRN